MYPSIYCRHDCSGQGRWGRLLSGLGGQYVTHVGVPPQRSHFNISLLGPTRIAPKGQASTQSRQLMHFSSLMMTTPVWVDISIAPGIGQASRQGVFLQYRQMIGWDFPSSVRFNLTRAKNGLTVPVLASEQANRHSSQPLQSSCRALRIFLYASFVISSSASKPKSTL